MNKSELKNLANELDSRWPLKFQDEDMKLWCERLSPFAYFDVVKALTTWKNGEKGHMAPRIPEITGLLPKQLTQNDARARIMQRYRSVTARMIVAKKPALFGEPETVILLKSYRVTYRARVSLRRQCGGKLVDQLIDADRRRLEFDCAKDLSVTGMDFEECLGWSLLISAGDEQFNEGIAELSEAKMVESQT